MQRHLHSLAKLELASGVDNMDLAVACLELVARRHWSIKTVGFCEDSVVPKQLRSVEVLEISGMQRKPVSSCSCLSFPLRAINRLLTSKAQAWESKQRRRESRSGGRARRPPASKAKRGCGGRVLPRLHLDIGGLLGFVGACLGHQITPDLGMEALGVEETRVA